MRRSQLSQSCTFAVNPHFFLRPWVVMVRSKVTSHLTLLAAPAAAGRPAFCRPGSFRRRVALCSPRWLEGENADSVADSVHRSLADASAHTQIRDRHSRRNYQFIINPPVSYCLTIVVDVIRVAVLRLLLLLLLIPSTTAGHDEVTGSGHLSSLCGQKVSQWSQPRRGQTTA